MPSTPSQIDDVETFVPGSDGVKPSASEPQCRPLGRRDRKKAQTRAAIETAALELFAAHGYSDTTLEDITEAADIAPRTFFRYFASKEELLVGDVHERIPQLAARLAARPVEESPLDAVLNALLEVGPEDGEDMAQERERQLLRARLVETDPAVLAAFLQSYAAWEQVIANYLRDRRAGLDPDDPYPALLAASIMGALRVISIRWAQAGGSDDLIAPLFAAARSYLGDGFEPSPTPRHKA